MAPTQGEIVVRSFDLFAGTRPIPAVGKGVKIAAMRRACQVGFLFSLTIGHT